MQALAAWLVARPLNAVLALAATVTLPFVSFLSGVVVIFLMLHKGLKGTLIDVGLAAAITAAIAFVVSESPAALMAGAIGVWLPALLLGLALVGTRSLALTMQLSAMIAAAAMVGVDWFYPELAEFWRGFYGEVIETWRETGQIEQAEAATADLDLLVRVATVLSIVVTWAMNTVGLATAYKLYRQLPGRTPKFGRFRDLDMGRVLAGLTAVVCVASVTSGAAWVENVAFVLFATFWLQGLAIVHWLYRKERIGRQGFVAVHVLLLIPLVNLIAMMAFAIRGYIDSWFRQRRREI